MSVSNKYAPINTNEIVDKTLGILANVGVTCTTRYIKQSRGGGTRHCVELLLNRDISVFGDRCKPRILIFNSNQGESRFSVMVGLYRLVCSNGLTIGTTIYHETVTHIVGRTFDSKMSEIEYKIAGAIEQLDAAVLQLTGLPLQNTVNIFEEHVMTNMLGLSTRLTSYIIDAIHNPNRRAVDMGTLWGYYNIVNEVLRENSRSEYRNEVVNTTLMDDVVRVYNEVLQPNPIAA